MATLTFTPAVAADFQRISEHLSSHYVKNAAARIAQIMSAAKVLEHSPIIGRPVRGDIRELIIGKGATGYLLLYRYAEPIDEVFILAVRSQREFGYNLR